MAALRSRNHKISLAQAAKHTKRHRATLTGKPADGDHAGAFHAAQVIKLLRQKGCTALRIYHGRTEAGRRSMVLVGVDKNGNDMTKGLLYEMCFPCPPFCDEDESPLLES